MCQCWDNFRKGKCSTTDLQNFGITASKRNYSMRFFLRTGSDGENLGDTSTYYGHSDDFVYDHDKTCLYGDSNPSM